MGNVSGWYDPICYQFSFYAMSDQEVLQPLADACRQFAEDLAPYHALWLSLNGRLLGETWTENGCRITMISDANTLERYRESLSPHTYNRCELSVIPGKVLTHFAVSARSIDKTWKGQVARFTDLKQYETIDREELKEWLYQLMNCPTDNLRGIYFPKRCFMPGEVPLKLSYACWNAKQKPAYMDEILQDGFGNALQTQYLHCIRVSIPRYVLDAMNQTFLLQYAWKERLATLCNMFENGVGIIKMDACEINHSSPILTGSGSFIPGFSRYLPDVSWAMCLTKRQADSLGGVEYLRSMKSFHDVQVLKNGNVYLQLTSNISLTTKAEAAKLWQIVSNHLRMKQYNCYSIGEVPMSFRFGLECSQLQMGDLGQYRLLL